MKPLDRYTCEEALRRLDDYLDRELRAEEMTRVQKHLETCEVCAREFTFEAGVLRQVRSKLQRIAVPTSLRTRLAQALAEERARGEGKWNTT